MITSKAFCAKSIFSSQARIIRPNNPRNFSSYSRFQQRYQYQRFGGGPTYSRARGTLNVFQRWAARPTFYAEIGGIGALAGSVYVYNLEVVPVSGRRRFNLISPEMETQLAQEQYALVMQEYGQKILSERDPRTRLVQKVLNRLIPASGLTGLDWEIHVVDSPETNAFVIPG